MAASHDLTAKAVDLALATLKPGGSLVAKVFQGPGFDELVAQVRKAFKLGKAHKPPGSKPSSREIYLLGRQLKATMV
jgi:23S rRNA (uridine2552-2'-O)-methyltransferase